MIPDQDLTAFWEMLVLELRLGARGLYAGVESSLARLIVMTLQAM